jgi:hypothetical protein
VGTGLLVNWGASRLTRNPHVQDTPAPDACVEDAVCGDGVYDPCTGSACVEVLCAYFIVDYMHGYVCCGHGACCLTSESRLPCTDGTARLAHGPDTTPSGQEVVRSFVGSR